MGTAGFYGPASGQYLGCARGTLTGGGAWDDLTSASFRSLTHATAAALGASLKPLFFHILNKGTANLFWKLVADAAANEATTLRPYIEGNDDHAFEVSGGEAVNNTLSITGTAGGAYVILGWFRDP